MELNMLTTEQINKLKIMGGLNYSTDMMVQVLDLEETQTRDFLSEFENENSEIRKAYERGKLISVFAQHTSLLKKAQAGDTKAITEINRIRKSNKF